MPVDLRSATTTKKEQERRTRRDKIANVCTHTHTGARTGTSPERDGSGGPERAGKRRRRGQEKCTDRYRRANTHAVPFGTSVKLEFFVYVRYERPKPQCFQRCGNGSERTVLGRFSPSEHDLKTLLTFRNSRKNHERRHVERLAQTKHSTRRSHLTFKGLPVSTIITSAHSITRNGQRFFDNSPKLIWIRVMF